RRPDHVVAWSPGQHIRLLLLPIFELCRLLRRHDRPLRPPWPSASRELRQAVPGAQHLGLLAPLPSLAHGVADDLYFLAGVQVGPQHPLARPSAAACCQPRHPSHHVGFRALARNDRELPALWLDPRALLRRVPDLGCTPATAARPTTAARMARLVADPGCRRPGHVPRRGLLSDLFPAAARGGACHLRLAGGPLMTARGRVVVKLAALAALVLCLLMFSVPKVDFVYTGF